MKTLPMHKIVTKTGSVALLFFNLWFTACAQSPIASPNNQTSTPEKSPPITSQSGKPQSPVIETKPNKQIEKEIWTGESGGFLIRWTTADLIAQSVSDKKAVFSARDFADKGFEQYYKSVKERKDLGKDLKAEIDFYNRHFRLLSVVGSLISFEDNLDASSKILKLPAKENFAYRDIIESRFLTIDLTKPGELLYLSDDDEPSSEIDLTKPGKAIQLTDLFSEQDILQALLKDAIIKRAMSLAKQSKQIKQPTNLGELLAVLEGNLGVKNCPFDFADDYLTRFAFHHVENDKVAVRLSLSSGNTACKGEKAQLGLLLPIPASLKESLTLADSNKQGFLMKQQAMKFTPKQETYVGFDDESIVEKK